MKRQTKAAEEKSVLDLVERAFHLLRRTPLHIIALFYIGSVPFMLGLLFFIIDMGSNPFAAERCADTALGIGLLYIWMRTWQALFCQRLYTIVKNNGHSRISLKKLIRLFAFHLTYSSWAVILLPATALIALPFGWVYAYFNNLCFVDPDCSGFSKTAGKARDLSMPWPRQNHLLISLLFGFSWIVFVNITSAMVYIPNLLKSLGGIETAFSKSFHWIFTPTFVGIAGGLTYLAVDPLVKAAYTLRCHASESVRTGEDLLIKLQSLPPLRRRGTATTLAFIILFSGGLLSKTYADSLAANKPAVINTVKLDAAIDRVMKNPEFTWRMPGQFGPEEDSKTGFFDQFFTSVVKWFEKTTKSFVNALADFIEWLYKKFHYTPTPHKNRPLNPGILKITSIALLFILIGILAVLLLRALRTRRRRSEQVREALPAIAVDLEQAGIVATLLEENEWIALARRLAAEGDLRKALRARFLAGIAFLAQKELLFVTQFKSNMDYRRELSRRARRFPDIPVLFTENIRLFERVWYGMHSASLQDISLLEQNTERMRRGIEP